MRRAQVDGDDAEIVIEGEVGTIIARLPRPLPFVHSITPRLQASGENTKITNTGTGLVDDLVRITARMPCPSAS